MSLFQRLAGDTSTFAMRLGFDRDPDDGRGASPEEAASWGSFQIWVGGKNLCAHWDEGEETGEVRWYLLPLIEWLVDNWNRLLHEGKLPLKTKGDNGWTSLNQAYDRLALTEAEEEPLFDWAGAHSLLTTRNGGLFPDIVFRRLGAMIEVSWGESLLPGAPPHCRFFAGRGHDVISPVVVSQSIHDVVSDAVLYLKKQCPNSQRISLLERSLADLRNPEFRSLRLAWLAGLGRGIEEITEKWRLVTDRIRSRSAPAAEVLLNAPDTGLVVQGSCDAALMFGSASPNLSETDLFLLADKLVESFLPGGEPGAVRQFVIDRPCEAVCEPWSEGYGLAAETLGKLSISLEETDSVDVAALAESLGVRIEESRFEDTELRAVAIAGQDHRPTILLNNAHATNRYPSGRRFSIAHELCHVLFDRSWGNSLAIVSGPWAPATIEKRANAFAAMLLMPTSLVMRHVGMLKIPLESEEGIGRLASALGVSYTSLLHHLGNTGILSEENVEALLELAGFRKSEGH